ncbi:MAG TPA: TonB-dependent receptor [bacterium]|nr:TonB-dependent receptor [bacterium]HPN45371.1 TonB-dependent receptor [bacterium]
MMNPKTFQSLVIAFLIAFPWGYDLYAFSIQGRVLAVDRSAIENANILIPELQRGAASDADGEFHITGLPAGHYTVQVSHIGYEPVIKTVTIENADVALDITLHLSVLKGRQITISATRARERVTPVAYTDITAQQVQQKYWAQEIPLLLDEAPGVYAFSYTSSGLGYSEVKIRGFDATRVGVTINDVPLNDPLDHVTYFYDLPDISANVRDIQVQRGVANSLYGTGALAGSVNIKTETAGDARYINFTTVNGSYNTRKNTLSFGSGLVNNTYSFYGRYSQVKSDGYRDMSWVDSWSYFFSATRYGKNLTTTVNLFGGPMRAHFAWEGITKQEMKINRKLNYDDYKNAADNFNQPHYQLLNEWQMLKNLTVSSTLFYIKGDGYYEQLKYGRDLAEYNLPEFIENNITVTETDLVRQKWVDKKQYGWIPCLEYKLKNHTLSLGGEMSIFRSHHWGEVTWAANLPPNVMPGHEYYQYNIDKNSVAVYINDLMQITQNLYLKADLQYQYQSMEFAQKRLGAFYGYNYKLNYNFITPRLGLNYNINNNLNVFGNFSTANREPRDSDIYDADDPAALPLFRTMNPDRGIYRDPYIKAETLYDFETGAGLQFDLWQLKLNAFWMNFNNEIVATGGITDDGYPIYGNAKRSVHRGIELDFKADLPRQFTLAANTSYSDNYFVEYTEYLWNADWSGNVAYSRNGNAIAGFPALMSNLRINKTIGGLFLSAHVQHIGRIYLDNTQQQELSIAPYQVVNLSAGFNLPDWLTPLQLSTAVHVNNVLNRKYELSGYTWDGVAYYLPAAERNFYVTIQTQL